MQTFLVTVKEFVGTSARLSLFKRLFFNEVNNFLMTEKLLIFLVGITSKTLKSWRKTGVIPYAKLRGKNYYAFLDILELLKLIYLTLPNHVILDMDMLV